MLVSSYAFVFFSWSVELQVSVHPQPSAINPIFPLVHVDVTVNCQERCPTLMLYSNIRASFEGQLRAFYSSHRYGRLSVFIYQPIKQIITSQSDLYCDLQLNDWWFDTVNPTNLLPEISYSQSIQIMEWKSRLFQLVSVLFVSALVSEPSRSNSKQWFDCTFNLWQSWINRERVRRGYSFKDSGQRLYCY